MRPSCFDNGECEEFIRVICLNYDYIIISDIIPDAFTFIVNSCPTKIVLEITNRFDIFVKDNERNEYLSRFSNNILESGKNGGNVTVVANNPYETFYACQAGVYIPYHYLIRPLGVAPPEVTSRVLSLTKKFMNKEKIAIIDRTWQDKGITKIYLEKYKINYKLLDWMYGGPIVLASYKAVIILPYQVSVMKMMENFRCGVAMMIPTLRFFSEELVIKDEYTFAAKSLKEVENGYGMYMEWYQPEFSKYFVYFDSWEEMSNLVETYNFSQLKEDVKNFIKNEYEDIILNSWKSVFNLPPYSDEKENDENNTNLDDENENYKYNVTTEDRHNNINKKNKFLIYNSKPECINAPHHSFYNY